MDKQTKRLFYKILKLIENVHFETRFIYERLGVDDPCLDSDLRGRDKKIFELREELDNIKTKIN